MKDELQEDLFAEADTEAIEEFTAALTGASHVYIKKLSLNDWQWSENPQAHQGGFYVPQADRDSGFFPSLSEKERNEGGKPILEAWFDIIWPQAGGEIKKARLVNYTSKGQETHLTNVVKEPFRGISPASLLMIAKRPRGQHESQFTALIADSSGAAAEFLRDQFELSTSFLSGVFEPEAVAQASNTRVMSYVDQAISAWKNETLDQFAREHAQIPATTALAQRAQTQYLKEQGLGSLDPFVLDAPGDAVMQISRDIEYRMFKECELRSRSMELVRIILGSDLKATSIESAMRAIINSFPLIDKVMLSAAQQRKSRAGKSFELHIERLLKDGKVPHEVQVVIDAKKRPDFVLPSYRLYRDANRGYKDALVLSAKTTLRERWKQVHAEIRNCDLYLATVDENVAASSIEDMAEAGISLVVPESLKNSDTTVYKKHHNVLSFRDYFKDEIGKRRLPLWK